MDVIKIPTGILPEEIVDTLPDKGEENKVYIPCIHISTVEGGLDEAGMYDTLTGTFYNNNSGNGGFTAEVK